MRTRHLNDETIQSYLEAGRFQSAEHALHFRGCPACRETAARYRRLSRWLDSAEPRFTLPPDFIPSVLNRLERPAAAAWGSVLRWILPAVVFSAAVFTVFRFQWLKPFLAVTRSASALLGDIFNPLIDSARAFRPGADPFRHWLLMSCAILLFAAVLDVVMRRFKEVLVDKHR
jgi:predicted anti-sigma-YlaC factor YlaD